MRRFREMIEWGRTWNVARTSDEAHEKLQHLKHEVLSGKLNGTATRNFAEGKTKGIFAPFNSYEYGLFERSRPFVFSPKEPISMDDTEGRDALIGLAEVDGHKLVAERVPEMAAPFTEFSIENAGGGPIAYYPKVETNSPALDIATNNNRIDVLCLFVYEVSPTFFKFFSFERSTSAEVYRVIERLAQRQILDHYLTRLSRERTGLETTRTTVKLGTGKDKRLHRIREVIHVRPKSDAVGGVGSKEIDWSHRFEVRGHWRVCSGIGKDRAGMYCVNGFTWVSEHVRGPEHLPLIKKTRLVD